MAKMLLRFMVVSSSGFGGHGRHDCAKCPVFSSSHTWLSSTFFAAAQNESAKSSFALNLRSNPYHAQSSSVPNVRQPAAPVRLAASHACIRRIDTSRATALPGMRAVLTSADAPEISWYQDS
jgi:hypothetical protein